MNQLPLVFLVSQLLEENRQFMDKTEQAVSKVGARSSCNKIPNGISVNYFVCALRISF